MSLPGMNTVPPADTAPASGGPFAGSVFVAIDIGAYSGRVILGKVTGGRGGTRAELETVHRFPNGVKEEDLGQYYANRTILKREVVPENVADAVYVLTGPELSRTTGLHIPVDSGVAAAFLR